MGASEAKLLSTLRNMIPPKEGKVGILLVNIGTPEEPTPKAVRRYLREFLSDPRVIEIPRWRWWPILNGLVLPTRSKESGKRYAGIWDRANNQSPLKTFSQAQADGLAKRLSALSSEICISWGMRYGKPSIGERLDELQSQGCDRIVILPLYPQYAAASTASTVDAVFAHLSQKRAQPSVSFVPPFYREEVYIQAITSQICISLSELTFIPEVLLISFHGVPIKSCLQGDPYFHQCCESYRLMAHALQGRIPCECRLTFQSRFGRDPWLQPYTDKTLITLGQSGVKNVAIVTPGFMADCLETLEEIAEENASFFKESGGQEFAALSCLNATPKAIDLLEHLVRPWLHMQSSQAVKSKLYLDALEQAC
jgi:ferrochelatase